MWMFGGRCSASSTSSDLYSSSELWCLEMNEMRWTLHGTHNWAATQKAKQRNTNGQQGGNNSNEVGRAWPEPRDGHTMSGGGMLGMYLFGGSTTAEGVSMGITPG